MHDYWPPTLDEVLDAHGVWQRVLEAAGYRVIFEAWSPAWGGEVARG